jgi:hypothetical protein
MCSTLEAQSFFGSNEAALRARARAVDAGITRADVTLDGNPVPLQKLESGLLHLNLPADNVFGAPGPGSLSVAHRIVSAFRSGLRGRRAEPPELAQLEAHRVAQM